MVSQHVSRLEKELGIRLLTRTTRKVTPTETILDEGDTIVLYTDGITDVRPPFALDDAALLELVRKSCDRAADAEATASNLIARIEDVLPIQDRNDDLAIVVVRVARSTAAS